MADHAEQDGDKENAQELQERQRRRREQNIEDRTGKRPVER